jgi:hypothetical protein
MLRFFQETVRRLPSELAAQGIITWLVSAAGTIGAMIWSFYTDAPMWALPPVAILSFVGIYWLVATIRDRRAGVAIAHKIVNDPRMMSEILSDSSSAPQLEIVENQDFTGKTVRIDGKHLINCTFKDCTVQYDGGYYQITHCHRQPGAIVFASQSLEIIRVLPLLKFIGLVPENTQAGLVELAKQKPENGTR